MEGENAPIGIIICRDKNKTVVEYALRTASRPIKVPSFGSVPFRFWFINSVKNTPQIKAYSSFLSILSSSVRHRGGGNQRFYACLYKMQNYSTW